MEDLPVYLISTSLNWPSREVVHVNVRQSLAAEDTALLNDLPLERFRDIMVDRFKFEAKNVDRKIEEMRNGHGFSFSLSMAEPGLYETGLLTR
jgi:hypothetical protein